MAMIPLWWYLMVAAGLFTIGLYGALVRKNAVSVLMGIELMLNAVNVNAVAFWRYVSPTAKAAAGADRPVGDFVVGMDGQVFAVVVIALAAAEAAVGLAMVIALYRSRRSVNLPQMDQLQG